MPLASGQHLIVCGDVVGIQVVQKFRMLREYGRRQLFLFPRRIRRVFLWSLLQQLMQRHIEAESIGRYGRKCLMLFGHESLLECK